MSNKPKFAIPVLDYEVFLKNKTESDISSIYNSLVVDLPIRKVKESVFINEILPVLTGETTNAGFPALVAAVAGNPFLEIDIIDNAGQTLFRMPSLLDRNIFDHKESGKRGSIGNMLVTVGQISMMSPKRAAHYLAHEFSNRGIAPNAQDMIAAKIDRWNVIFARYGKVFMGPPSSKAIANSKPDDRRMEVDLENDDLF